jgi:hypothetical protein
VGLLPFVGWAGPTWALYQRQEAGVKASRVPAPGHGRHSDCVHAAGGGPACQIRETASKITRQASPLDSKYTHD